MESELLKKLGTELTTLNVLHPIPYQSRWEDWFGDYSEISALRAQLDDGLLLTRPLIKTLADKAKQNSGEIEPLRLLFVATMMWGWGSAARAHVYVRAAMCDRLFNAVLLNLQTQLLLGGISEAYVAANELNGCGEPFATKLLYFMGWPYQIGNEGFKYLILDSQIRKTLRHYLGPDWGQAPSFWRGLKKWEIYNWYIRQVSLWAKQLGIATHPDQIEQLLFTYGQELGKAARNQKRIQRG